MKSSRNHHHFLIPHRTGRLTTHDDDPAIISFLSISLFYKIYHRSDGRFDPALSVRSGQVRSVVCLSPHSFLLLENNNKERNKESVSYNYLAGFKTFATFFSKDCMEDSQ